MKQLKMIILALVVAVGAGIGTYGALVLWFPKQAAPAQMTVERQTAKQTTDRPLIDMNQKAAFTPDTYLLPTGEGVVLTTEGTKRRAQLQGFEFEAQNVDAASIVKHYPNQGRQTTYFASFMNRQIVAPKAQAGSVVQSESQSLVMAAQDGTRVEFQQTTYTYTVQQQAYTTQLIARVGGARAVYVIFTAKTADWSQEKARALIDTLRVSKYGG